MFIHLPSPFTIRFILSSQFAITFLSVYSIPLVDFRSNISFKHLMNNYPW